MLIQKLANLSFPDLAAVFTKKEYRFHTTEEAPNLFGVRSKSTTTDVFNDVLGLAYTYNGVQRVLTWEGTTDPGKPSLENPINRDGCAIMVPGQYRNAYLVGTHARGRKSEHKALVQTAAKVAVFRDDNRDDRLDFNEETIQWGFFGISLHRASKYRKLVEVGPYSAGCQVWADPAEFEVCLSIVEKMKGPFDYTLLLEEDFAL